MYEIVVGMLLGGMFYKLVYSDMIIMRNTDNRHLSNIRSGSINNGQLNKAKTIGTGDVYHTNSIAYAPGMSIDELENYVANLFDYSSYDVTKFYKNRDDLTNESVTKSTPRSRGKIVDYDGDWYVKAVKEFDAPFFSGIDY